METEELMLHDYVQRLKHGGTMVKEYEVLRVKALNAYSRHHIITYTADERFTPADCRLRDLEFVPLTPEILKKNGFHYFSGSIYPYWYNEVVDITVESSADAFGTEVLGRITEIKYVHELQHLLRSCGLNDFANNFEI